MSNLINSLNFGDTQCTFTLPHCFCNEGSNLATKNLTMDNFVLQDGAMFLITFSGGHSSTTMSLNINGTGAKSVVHKNSVYNIHKLVKTNYTYMFIYHNNNVGGVSRDGYEIVNAVDPADFPQASWSSPGVVYVAGHKNIGNVSDTIAASTAYVRADVDLQYHDVTNGTATFSSYEQLDSASMFAFICWVSNSNIKDDAVGGKTRIVLYAGWDDTPRTVYNFYSSSHTYCTVVGAINYVMSSTLSISGNTLSNIKLNNVAYYGNIGNDTQAVVEKVAIMKKFKPAAATETT